MNTWIVVGSGPSAPIVLPSVMAAHPGATTITTNGGIDICQKPDVLVLIDQLASHTFAEQARHAQSHGTRLVTLRRDIDALISRNCHWYDEFVTVPGHAKPTKTSFGRFVRSGPFCVEYACQNGADLIVLVGWDGYASGYANGRQVPNNRVAAQDSINDEVMVEIKSAHDVIIVRVGVANECVG